MIWENAGIPEFWGECQRYRLQGSRCARVDNNQQMILENARAYLENVGGTEDLRNYWENARESPEPIQEDKIEKQM